MIRFIAFIVPVICLLLAKDVRALILARDAQTEEVLSQIAAPIFTTAELSDKIRINIIQDHRINAFITDAKNVYINTGLISFTDDPSAIAGVIAHECGHIHDGHIVRQSEKLQSLNKATLLGTVMGIAGIAAGQAELGSAAIIGSSELAARDMLGYVLTHEHSADISAVSYMNNLNIPSNGIIKLLKQLDIESRAYRVKTNNKAITSHPLAQQRIDYIIRNSKYDPNNTKKLLTPNIRHQFSMAVAKIYAYTHTVAETNRRYAKKYDVDIYATSIADFRSNKLANAIDKLDLLIAKYPYDPYIYELKGQFYLENRKVELAVENYNIAYKLMPTSPLIQIQLAVALIHYGGKDYLHKAIMLLQNASNHELDNNMIWKQISVAYSRIGDKFASYIALAKEAAFLKDHLKLQKHLNQATNYPKSSDKFIMQIYTDLKIDSEDRDR